MKIKKRFFSLVRKKKALFLSPENREDGTGS